MFIDYKLRNSRILGTNAYYQACCTISAFNTPVKYINTMPDMLLDKVGTNSGKQTIANTAAILWGSIPTHLKDLNTLISSKH